MQFINDDNINMLETSLTMSLSQNVSIDAQTRLKFMISGFRKIQS